MRTVYFPILAQLMSRHGLNKGDISKIIGKSYRQTLKKLNQETNLTLNAALSIARFFQDKGDTITVEEIFQKIMTYLFNTDVNFIC